MLRARRMRTIKEEEEEEEKETSQGTRGQSAANDTASDIGSLRNRKYTVNGRLYSTMCLKLGTHSTFRVGLRKNKVTIRISSEYDLSENRAHPPSEIVGMENPSFPPRSDKSLTPNTVFLKYDHGIVLLKLITFLKDHYRQGKVRDEIHVLCTYDEEQYIDHDREMYPYYVHCFPTATLDKDRVLTISTYAAQTGQNQMQMVAVESGSVSLPYDEWIKLSDDEKHYRERIKEINLCHLGISDIILTKAGEYISSMIRTKIGPFEIGQSATEEQVFKAFLESYSEFNCYHYVDNLHKEISEEVRKKNLWTYNINLKHLIRNVLSQFDVMYNSEYLK